MKKQNAIQVLLLGFMLSSSLKIMAQTAELPYPILMVHGFIGDESSFAGPGTLSEWYEQNLGVPAVKIFHACLSHDQNRESAILDADVDSIGWTYFDQTNLILPNNNDQIFAINFSDKYFQHINGHGAHELSNQAAPFKQGRALQMAIRGILRYTGKSKVILIGHSMGGIAIREYLQRSINTLGGTRHVWWAFPDDVENGHRVARVLTIGTPHLGSNAGIIDPLRTQKAASLQTAETMIPYMLTEAVRDLRYSYTSYVGPCAYQEPYGIYLFGGNEACIDDDVLLQYYNVDINCNGLETDDIIGINSKFGAFDEPRMPLPDGILYTWLTSNTNMGENMFEVGTAGDGVVLLERQWLHTPDGRPMPANLADTLLMAVSHSKEKFEKDDIIRGADEPDQKEHAYQIQSGRDYFFFSTLQPHVYHLDYDWFRFQVSAPGRIRVLLTQLPAQPGRPTIAAALLAENSSVPLATQSNTDGRDWISFYSPQLTSGSYYLRILSEASTSSWAHPGRLQISSAGNALTAGVYLSAAPALIQANGSSTSIVRAEVRDEYGNRLTEQQGAISFTILSGSESGQLVGANPARLVDGVATIMLQSKTTPGQVLIEASGANLASGSTTITVFSQATEVKDDIDRNTIWTRANAPYIITRDISVRDGVILTIEPGVTVRFNPGTDMTVNGALIATGTANLPISFSSNADNPGPGAWGGITINNSRIGYMSTLSYCDIAYGGSGGYGNRDVVLQIDPRNKIQLANLSMHDNNLNGVDIPFTNYGSNIELTDAGVPYISRSDWSVASTATLLIHPGVIIKFASSVDLRIDGTLKAEGTPAEHIVFTSIYDDANGGDTDGSGSTAGKVSDWGGLEFNQSSGGSRLDYCDIYYGGGGGYLTLDAPVKLHPFSNPKFTHLNLQQNRLNGIDLMSGQYDRSISLNLTEIAYTLRGNLTIKSTAILTIAPGVILKMDDGCNLGIEGGMMAQGLANQHIVFTSLRDDLYGGDSNGNGPSQGQGFLWGGINFSSSINDAQTRLRFVDICYAGAGGYGVMDSPIRIDPRKNPYFDQITFIETRYKGIDVVCGDFDSDIHLQDYQIPYLFRDNLRVRPSARMTIDAGVLIKLVRDCDIYVEGILQANGTSSNRIQFTSLYDDASGGDSENSPTSGTPGDWGGIEFSATNSPRTSAMQYCDIQFAGRGGYGNNATPIYVHGAAQPVIENCILRNNNRNAVELAAETYNQDVTLDIVNMPYLLRSDLSVASSATLSIRPGVRLKFEGGCQIHIHGAIQARGSSQYPIIFTSAKDDSVGGDSNGDGVSVGSRGEWGGIYINDTSADDRCLIEYAIFKYGGGSGYGVSRGLIACNQANPKIQHCRFYEPRYYGVVCYGNGSPDLGLGAQGSEGYNEFIGFQPQTDRYAVYNDGNATIQARNNYWETGDINALESIIYDQKDNKDKGRVVYAPFKADTVGNHAPPVPVVLWPQQGEELEPSSCLVWTCAHDPDALDSLGFEIELSMARDFSHPVTAYFRGAELLYPSATAFSSSLNKSAAATLDSWNIVFKNLQELSNPAFYLCLSNYTGFSNLMDDSTYFWRVKARDRGGLESAFSQPAGCFFFNRMNSTPILPQDGFSPSAGLEVRTSTPVLCWPPAQDPDKSDHAGTLIYEVQLDQDGEFLQDARMLHTTAPGMNTLELPTPLLENQLWSYRVRVRDDEGSWSGWSAIHSFWVNAQDEPPFPFDMLQPGDNTLVQGDSLRFTWVPATDPDPNDLISYTLAFSPVQDFSAETVIVSGLKQPSTIIALKELPASRYYWRVEARDSDDLRVFASHSDATPWTFFTQFTGMASEENALPDAYALQQNYPNPFNGATVLQYDLPRPARVILSIHSSTGQMIWRQEESQCAGQHYCTWSAQDQNGQRVPTGTYFVHIRVLDAGETLFTAMRKMVLVR